MPSNQLPVGILASGAAGISEAISGFEKARQVDRESGGESMPGAAPGDARRRASIHKNNMKPRRYSVHSKTSVASSTSTTTTTASTTLPKIMTPTSETTTTTTTTTTAITG